MKVASFHVKATMAQSIAWKRAAEAEGHASAGAGLQTPPSLPKIPRRSSSGSSGKTSKRRPNLAAPGGRFHQGPGGTHGGKRKKKR
jgi:hypothetical protein